MGFNSGFNIADLFERAVDVVPDRTALVCGPRRLTYDEFDREANQLANQLLGEGFGHGDHIGIYGQNSAEWLVAMMAVFKIRAVPININFRYVEGELTYLFDNADLVALVCDRAYADRIAAVLPHVPGLRHFVTIDDSSDVDTSMLPGAVTWADATTAASPKRPQLPRSGNDRYVLYTGEAMTRPLAECLAANPDRWDLSSLFVLSSSAVVFSPSLKDEMLDLLPDIIVVDAIGSSESGLNGMTVQSKGQTANQNDSGGPTVTAGRDAVVLDENLEPLPPGTGAAGKLARSGKPDYPWATTLAVDSTDQPA